MPVDPKKRQKKQERRAAKRKSKQQQLTKEKHAGLPERLSAAARYPILHSWVIEDYWTQGLGWACLSRALPNGSVAYAVFLVDRYCMGVKNAVADVASRFSYDSQIAGKMRAEYETRDLSPAAIRKLVEGAVEYARDLGLPPHPEYQKAKLIFGDIDSSECTDAFEFGKDGKPFFISGPNDSLKRCQQILKTLSEKCGTGASDFLMQISDSASIGPVPLDQAGRVIGGDKAIGSID